jgi:hypothetical protein
MRTFPKTEEGDMKMRMQCEGCQTVYVAEDDRPDAEDSFARFLAREGCDDCGGHTFTPICSGDDEECECGRHWSDEYGACLLFLEYAKQYRVWHDPMQGAVTPDLSEFFRFCDPELPALVHWARWLRIEHKRNKGAGHPDAGTIPLERGEALLEAMIALKVNDRANARQMRLAFYEGFGERNPDQLELIPKEDV